MRFARDRARSAFILPMVVLAVVLMAILGMVLIGAATSDYAQSALTAHGLRARELAQAALEEARTVVYDQVNRPAPPPPWKQVVFDAAALAVAKGEQGVVFQRDLLRDGLLPRAARIALDLDGALVSATVEFLGFRRMAYVSSGVFLRDDVYYTDPARVMDRRGDPAGTQAPREYTGYFRLRVASRCGRIERRLAEVSDVKIVSTTPVAREFALFSHLSTLPGPPDAPADDAYAREDLNRGGPVQVFAGGKGRVHLAGPYFLETEGNPDGAGGHAPPRSATYLSRRWHGWQPVPATRDGIVTRAGPPLLNFGVPPARPDKRSGSRAVVGVFTGFFGGLGALMGDDPGYYMLDGQQWYCETKEPDGRAFSLLGDPAAGRPDMFRGVLTRWNKGERTVERDAADLVRPDGTLPQAAPGNDEDRWVIEPEGALLGVYNVARYTYRSLAMGLFESYEIQLAGRRAARFGVHWEKQYEQDYWNRFASDLFRVGGAILGAAAGGLTVSLAAGLAGDAIASALAGGGGPLAELARSGAAGPTLALPPEWRPVERATTRHYASLSGLKSVRQGWPVLLDGILSFDDLSCDRPFTYAGRGYLATATASAPRLTAPILPAAAPPASSDSLVIFHGGGHRKPYRGEAMLDVRPAPGLTEATVVASVYSIQGVRTSGRLAIAGNLSCGYVNKSMLPDTAALSVHYDAARLAPRDALQFKDGRWHAVAVSQRVGLALEW